MNRSETNIFKITFQQSEEVLGGTNGLTDLEQMPFASGKAEEQIETSEECLTFGLVMGKVILF